MDRLGTPLRAGPGRRLIQLREESLPNEAGVTGGQSQIRELPGRLPSHRIVLQEAGGSADDDVYEQDEVDGSRVPGSESKATHGVHLQRQFLHEFPASTSRQILSGAKLPPGKLPEAGVTDLRPALGHEKASLTLGHRRHHRDDVIR